MYFFAEHADAPNIILDGETDSIVLTGRKRFELDAAIVTTIDAAEVQKMKKIIRKRKLKVGSRVGDRCAVTIGTIGVKRF